MEDMAGKQMEAGACAAGRFSALVDVTALISAIAGCAGGGWQRLIAFKRVKQADVTCEQARLVRKLADRDALLHECGTSSGSCSRRVATRWT
jgi:hypothetical protein